MPPSSTPTPDELDDALAAARVRPQVERDLAPLEHGPVDLVHPVDLPLLVARLLDVALVDDARRPVLEAADRLLEARDLLLLGDVHLLLALQLELARDGVRGVVARPHADAAAGELGDLRDGLVEQVAVVRDGDDRAVEGSHQMLHVLPRLDVEVRFRLVEQQHVGIAQQARGEPDELALAAGEDAGRLAEVVVVEADVGEERARAALEAGAAGGGPALEISSWRRSRRASCGRCRRPARRAARSTLRELALELVEVRARGAERLQRVAVVALELLRQEGDARARGAVVISPASAVSSPARMRSSVDLPPPFGPIIAHADARLDVEVEPVEDQPRAEALRDPACLEQRHAPRLDPARAAVVVRDGRPAVGRSSHVPGTVPGTGPNRRAVVRAARHA